MSGGTLRKRGQVWYGRIRRQGKEYEKSLETGSKAVARDRLNRWLEELKSADWGEKPRRTFDDAMRRFISEHLRLVKPSSADRYMTSLTHLIDHFAGLRLDEISSERLYKFEMARRRNVEAPTIRRDMACLRKLYSCAETWEWIGGNPVKAYLRGRGTELAENPPGNRVLTHQEEADLIASAIEWWGRPKTGERRPVPWHIIIPVAIDTGLRKQELFSLERSQLRLDREEVLVTAGKAKSRRDRSVPLLPRSRDLLTRWPSFLGKPWVFYRTDGNRYSARSPYVWESFQKIVRNAGIEDTLTIHDLRRACGCRLLRDRRMSMEEVSKWLGHSSIKVTEQVYAFLDIDHLHRAVKRTRRNVVTLPPGGNKVDKVSGFSNRSVAQQRISR
jgi:integrase/recombinase XerD